jgi:paraquat-inducible protein B
MTSRPPIFGTFILGAFTIAVLGILFFGGARWFARPSRVVVFFDESVAGLDVGAPVTFHGARVGRVGGIAIRFSPTTMEARIRVVLEIETSRLIAEGGRFAGGPADYQRLVQGGLRAQLALQSIITGQLRVDLEFLPGTPAPMVGHASACRQFRRRHRISSGFATT